MLPFGSGTHRSEKYKSRAGGMDLSCRRPHVILFKLLQTIALVQPPATVEVGYFGESTAVALNLFRREPPLHNIYELSSTPF